MAAPCLNTVARHLRGITVCQDAARLSDVDLWERYVQERDGSAFESLVRRHGPMVLSVCRRVLRNDHDAEDAFQATFLVLVRRAAGLQTPAALANWLHGVAYRTALEARSAAIRRRDREARVTIRTGMPENSWAELWPVLDQELGRLAEKYRVAVILCDLEGKTRKDVARQLGWAEGTVASRLARGRTILARGLARRGFTGPLAALALTQNMASACLPARLVVATVRAAGFPAAGYTAAKALVSAEVIALTEGVLQTMLFTRLKSGLAASIILGLAALAAGGLIARIMATEPAGAEQAVAKQDRKPEVRGAPELFKHRVPFEIGFTESTAGGRIEIREVWGTRPRIEVGGQYLVRGKYTLPRGERGKLYFYTTATGASGAVTSTLDLQMAALDKQEGEFTLVHGMSGPGFFHVVLADPERYSRSFANVYFGTGDNVLRTKP